MASNTPTTTRRSALALLAATPMMALPAVAAPMHAPASDLSAALAAAAQTAQRSREHDKVCAAAEARFSAMVAAIPHETVEWAPTMGFGETWTTEKAQQVATARRFVERAKQDGTDPCHESYYAAALALVAAADRRNAAIRDAHDTSGLTRINDESDKLLEEHGAAIDAVILCPVSTARDLARKIAFITERDQWEYEHTHRAIEADVRRMAGSAN